MISDLYDDSTDTANPAPAQPREFIPMEREVAHARADGKPITKWHNPTPHKIVCDLHVENHPIKGQIVARLEVGPGKTAEAPRSYDDGIATVLRGRDGRLVLENGRPVVIGGAAPQLVNMSVLAARRPELHPALSTSTTKPRELR